MGIAEVTIHHHRKAVSALVRELSRLGVPVLVDRFGVGGVPFSYLKRLPFRAVRIDHSFIHNLDRHDETGSGWSRLWVLPIVGGEGVRYGSRNRGGILGTL